MASRDDFGSVLHEPRLIVDRGRRDERHIDYRDGYQNDYGRVIDAMVPLANMFGYINTLRSASQGRAQFTMQFDHYEKVPEAVAEEVRANLA